MSMAVAVVLAVAWMTLNFGGMILVALAMVIGALIGRYLEGRLDVAGIVAAVRGRRSSS